MFKKFCGALFVMAVGVAFVAGDEYRGVITKVDGDKITVQKYKKGEKGKKGEKDGEPVTLTAKDVKVVKGKFNKEDKKVEAGDPIEGGLSHKMFKDIGEKGVEARITADGTTVTQILIMGGGTKKKKDSN